MLQYYGMRALNPSNLPWQNGLATQSVGQTKITSDPLKMGKRSSKRSGRTDIEHDNRQARTSVPSTRSHQCILITGHPGWLRIKLYQCGATSNDKRGPENAKLGHFTHENSANLCIHHLTWYVTSEQQFQNLSYWIKKNDDCSWIRLDWLDGRMIFGSFVFDELHR